jgi:hypothetical protein
MRNDANNNINPILNTNLSKEDKHYRIASYLYDIYGEEAIEFKLPQDIFIKLLQMKSNKE